jgi:uncharacterized iron-regulated membrane protein
MRRIAVVLHRYVGLFLAVFLVVAGLTGSLLVFNRELDTALNPSLMRVTPPSSGAEPLDGFALRDRLEAAVPGLRARAVPLKPAEPGHAVAFFVEPAGEGADDEYFVDPYTGRLLGSRRWGDITQGTKNLMPFAYKLHYSLALGEVGSLLFGIVALLWTLDCFVGAYLTFPAATKAAATSAGAAGWWRRWFQSWRVRTGSLFKLTFTWHRASGLWVWALLFVFAWSAVGLNLRPVYHPVMKATLGMDEWAHQTLPKRDRPLETPRLDWRAAHARGKQLMDAEAAARGLEVRGEERLRYDAVKGVYQYRAASSLDVSGRHGGTSVYFDGDTGERRGFQAPTGGAAGNTVTSWLYALHFAAVGGLPYRILVAVVGVLIAVLSVSGVYVWWSKRRSRRLQRRKAEIATAEGKPPAPDPTSVVTAAGMPSA